MSFELGGIIIAIILGAIGYGKLQNQVETSKETIPNPQRVENDNLWREIGKCRSEHDEYVRSAAERRIEFERSLSNIRETIGNRDGKLDAILDRLNSMDTKIDRLESRDKK